MEIDVETPGVGYDAEPLAIGSGIQVDLPTGTTIGLMGVAPHDFGNGSVPAAMLMITEPGAPAQRGWVGVGSSVRAGGTVWSVASIDVKNPGIVLHVPSGA